MRTTKSLLWAAMAILSVSCAKENIQETTPSTSEDGLVELTFNAVSAETTKTSLGENVDGKYAVNWSPVDKIAILDGDTGDTHEFNYVSGEGTQATFSGKVAADAKDFYALYPYSDGVTCDGTEYIDVPLSHDQATAATGISSGVMVAYADADMNLKFKNVTAFIKLTIPSGITYVSFAGANQEKLSGKLSFTFDGSTVSGVTGDDGKDVSFGDGSSELAAGTYYLAVAPVALPKGFVVEYMNVDGETKTETGTKDPELAPGMILNLGERNPFKPVELTRGAAWEWTASKKVWDKNGSATLSGTTDMEWTLAGDGGYWGVSNADLGLQFGSGKVPYKTMTLSSAFGASYGIDEIVVNASCAKDSDAKLQVSVGGKSLMCGEATSVSLTSSAANYTFKSTELLAGEVSIKLTQTTKKAIYVKSISINPEAVEDKPYLNLSTDKASVSADATSASFDVKSNVEWTVSTDADWVTLGTTSGSNDGTVSLTLTANEDTSDRTATITVKSTDNVISQTHTLTQKAKVSSAVKTLLFSEGFGSNSSSARNWNDNYKEQGGIQSVYSGASYTITGAKQSKNTVGQTKSGLSQSSNGTEASFIVGPLSVSQYEKLSVSYYWKAGSIRWTYSTNLYYSVDGTDYIQASTDAKGATTFVEVNSDLSSLNYDTLYLKITFNTSNTQAIIDEVKLYGYGK